MTLPLTEIALALLTALFVVLWWFYRQRDQDSKTAIALLFKKHDEDAEALNNLKIEIAKKHYERGDLDLKFDRMEETTRIGFRDMGDKFDKLSNTLMEFVARINGFPKKDN
jgi:hypothetical protein